MEKLIYLVWTDQQGSIEALNAALLGPVRSELAALGAARIQMNVIDDSVAAGAALRFESLQPMPSGMVSFWLNAAHDRAPFEAVLAGVAPRIAGYAVSESTVLPIAEPQPDGGRTRGFSQIAIFRKLPGIAWEGFLQIWMRDQTRVGPETQDTFFYAQNIVVRALTGGAPPLDGIVEECYPIAALTDPLVYWRANGSQEVMQANIKRELDNVARFIDGESTAVFVTSQHRFGGWTDIAKA